jgi:hypothetical protein
MAVCCRNVPLAEATWPMKYSRNGFELSAERSSSPLLGLPGCAACPAARPARLRGGRLGGGLAYWFAGQCRHNRRACLGNNRESVAVHFAHDRTTGLRRHWGRKLGPPTGTVSA